MPPLSRFSSILRMAVYESSLVEPFCPPCLSDTWTLWLRNGESGLREVSAAGDGRSAAGFREVAVAEATALVEDLTPARSPRRAVFRPPRLQQCCSRPGWEWP